jgi:hypothetical protein
MQRALCLLALGLVAAAPPSSWSQAAVQDLVAMHDLIRDNHPGPVDPRNPGFHDWLDGGEAALLPQARAARSLHDYQLVLRDYANGFADGHLSVSFTDQDAHLWPGFLARADAAGGPVRVTALGTGADAPTGLSVGMQIESCGGTAVGILLKERVQRPLLNPHVPQRMRLASTLLMVADADDLGSQWPGCVVSSDGHRRMFALHWRPIAPTLLAQERMRASGIAVPPTGLRRIGDVWLVSMPNFNPQDDAATAQWHILEEQVKAHAGELRAARHVVLDLRGNDGGDAVWGYQVAQTLWGAPAVAAADAALPTAVDWRVSARNVAALHADAAVLRKQGQAEDAPYFDTIADRMDLALRRHAVFLSEPAAPAGPAPHLASPFAHPVYLLTTPHCASACLDFIDLMNGLPGVVRVGLETSSDTDYLEMAAARLPSGKATLRYAMKVYRQRSRSANVSYKPAINWTGETMDDASIVKWIDSLQ